MSSRRPRNRKKGKKDRKGPGNDSRYFSTTKKGEIAELKSELNDLNEDVVKDAVKKVIACMTVGKDVSGLFPDVLKRMNTEDTELKKLVSPSCPLLEPPQASSGNDVIIRVLQVYLYIITYARQNPKEVLSLPSG